jgi:hypothetical protein
MAEDSYAGWNTYVVIRRQAFSTEQGNPFATGCPIRAPTYDAAGLPVSLNGIIWVGSAYAAIHASFAALIAAYNDMEGIVFDIDTGEGRYYDGTQAGDAAEFASMEQIAMGKIPNARALLGREVEMNDELGQMITSHLKAQLYRPELRSTKIYCDKKKLALMDDTSLVLNQDNFLGTGPVESGLMKGTIMNNLIRPSTQEYYLVILYTRDYSVDADNVARSWICPCAKFTRYEITADSKRTTEISMDAKGTYAYTLPNDYVNLENNAPQEN